MPVKPLKKSVVYAVYGLNYNAVAKTSDWYVSVTVLLGEKGARVTGAVQTISVQGVADCKNIPMEFNADSSGVDIWHGTFLLYTGKTAAYVNIRKDKLFINHGAGPKQIVMAIPTSQPPDNVKTPLS